MNEYYDGKELIEEEKKKIIFKDDQDFKAIKGWVVYEDEFFITLRASKSGLIFRIGKAYVVLIRPASYDQDFDSLSGITPKGEGGTH